MKQFKKAEMALVENEHGIAIYKDLIKDPIKYNQEDTEAAFEFHLRMLIGLVNRHKKLVARYERWKRINNAFIKVKDLFKR